MGVLTNYITEKIKDIRYVSVDDDGITKKKLFLQPTDSEDRFEINFTGVDLDEIIAQIGGSDGSFSPGSAALPGFTPSGDTNTGLWAPADDTLAWSTAGVERLRVSSSGVLSFGRPGTAEESGNTHLHVRQPSGQAALEWFDHFESNSFESGTYTDSTRRFGFGQDSAGAKQSGQPMFFIQTETKFRQNSGSPYGTEFHLNFARPTDSAVYNRPLSMFMEHVTGLVTTDIAGKLAIRYSDRDDQRYIFGEVSGAVFHDGAGLTLAWSASTAGTLGANFSFITDVRFPALTIRSNITEKFRLECDVVAGTAVMQAAAGLEIRHGVATAKGIVITQTAAQSVNLWEVRASDQFTVFSKVDKNGHFMTRKTAAPADADMVAGELAIWFDPTNGAAKAMFKAKETSGTVRTGSVALV